MALKQILSVLQALALSGAAASARGAAPEAYAKTQKPPRLAAPEPLTRHGGFTASELDLYAGALSPEHRATLSRLSDALMKSAFAGALRRAAAKVAAAEHKQKDEAAPREGELVTYALPDDPLIWLGTAKSYDGVVTALPRLVRGAFPPPAAAGAAPKPPDGEDDWLYASPAQACTGSLALGIPDSGAPFGHMEETPAPVALPYAQTELLSEIERNPSPFLRSTVDRPPAAAGEGEPAAPRLAPPAPRSPLAELGKLDKDAAALPAFAKAVDQALAALHSPAAGLLSDLADQDAALAAAKAACVKAGQAWTEQVKPAGRASAQLFGCAAPTGRLAGFSARLATGGGPLPRDIVIAFGDAATGLSAELHLALDRDLVLLAGAYDGEPYGPQVLFDVGGRGEGLTFNPRQLPDDPSAPFDVYEWHENGAVKLASRHQDGHPIGVERTWYASGALAGEVAFDDRGQILSYREWFNNYKPAEDTPMAKGRMDGTRRWWHPSGAPAGEIAYSAGEPDGAAQLWYDDGTRGAALTFKHGLPNGPANWWYDDGSPLYTGGFVLGKPDGAQTLYAPSHGPLSERTYKLGQPDGTWTAYDLNGHPLRDAVFRGGKKAGKSVLRYRQTGQPYVELSWVGGLLDGEAKSFYKDGQLASTCSFEKDHLAQFTRFSPAGDTTLEGTLADPEKGDGNFTAYRQPGQPLLECTLADFAVTTCTLYGASGQELPQPSDQTLLGKAKSWQPCGGYKRQVNYEPVIAGANKQYFVSFEAKGICPGQEAPATLTCLLKAGDEAVTVESCFSPQ